MRPEKKPFSEKELDTFLQNRHHPFSDGLASRINQKTRSIQQQKRLSFWQEFYDAMKISLHISPLKLVASTLILGIGIGIITGMNSNTSESTTIALSTSTDGYHYEYSL